MDEPDVDDSDRAAEAEDVPVSNGCEALAGFLLAIVWAMVLHGYLSALAWSRVSGVGDFLPAPTGLELMEIAAAGSLSVDSNPITFVISPILLVVAYVLAAVVGPGDLIGRAGTRALQGVRVTGLVVTINAVITLVAIGRRADRFQDLGPIAPEGSGSDDLLTTVVDRVGLALPLIAGTAAVVYVAWLANRLLTAGDDDDEPTATDGATEPLPA